MARVYTISNWRNGIANIHFDCPGCKCTHGVWTEKWIKDYDSNGNPVYGPTWEFNNDMDKPTFSPSILVRSKETCHSFIRDGMIQYLNDCTHELAGKTIELPEIE